MTLRTAVFAVFGAAVLALFAWGTGGLPPFGHYPGPYGDEVVHAMFFRHATNAVTTVVMDVRAADTAGEELILLAAAVGVLMLLRPMRGEHKDAPRDEPSDRPEPSMAVRLTCAALVGPTALLGWYVVAHGQITPGGGFQGGVILACPSLLVFLAARMRTFERLHYPPAWEFAQGVAVSGFLAVGFVGLAVAGGFLTNVMHTGTASTVFSAGTIDLLNGIVGPAVATAVVLIAVELLTQLTEVR